MLPRLAPVAKLDSQARCDGREQSAALLPHQRGHSALDLDINASLLLLAAILTPCHGPHSLSADSPSPEAAGSLISHCPSSHRSALCLSSQVGKHSWDIECHRFVGIDHSTYPWWWWCHHSIPWVRAIVCMKRIPAQKPSLEQRANSSAQVFRNEHTTCGNGYRGSARRHLGAECRG